MNNPFEILDARLRNIENMLLDFKQKPQAPAAKVVDEDVLLNVEQTAKLTHLKVSTIYEKSRKSEIPCMKKNNRLYFSKHRIIDWIRTGRQKTNTEIAAEADQYLQKQRKG